VEEICLQFVAEVGQGGGRLNIRRQAGPEDGRSNWKLSVVSNYGKSRNRRWRLLNA